MWPSRWPWRVGSRRTAAVSTSGWQGRGRELPHTWAAWRTGRITEWKATIVARETACLSLADRLTVDEVVAQDAAALEAMGERELAGACLREVARLDAAALVARRRRAESERRVTLRPAPDTMTYLTALLPVKDGVAASRRSDPGRRPAPGPRGTSAHAVR